MRRLNGKSLWPRKGNPKRNDKEALGFYQEKQAFLKVKPFKKRFYRKKRKIAFGKKKEGNQFPSFFSIFLIFKFPASAKKLVLIFKYIMNIRKQCACHPNKRKNRLCFLLFHILLIQYGLLLSNLFQFFHNGGCLN